jgi:hypothetical protein
VSTGEVSFRTLDVLAIPTLSDGEALLGMTCTYDGKEDLESFAIDIPRFGEPRELRASRLAWREPVQRAIRTVDPTRVTCWAIAGGP